MEDKFARFASTATRKERLHAMWLSFLYGAAFTAGLFVSGALLVLIFDFGPKAARLFYTTYIGG